jgi:hypothetical protein
MPWLSLDLPFGGLNSNSKGFTKVIKQPAFNWLVPLIGLLALVASGAGLFLGGGDGSYPFTPLRGEVVEIYGRGVYQHDTVFYATLFKGADAIVLFAGLPLLALSFRMYRRGSLKGGFLLAGALMYFLYIGASLTFSAAFNRLFLVYTALFSASLFALIALLSSIDLNALSSLVSPRLPHRGLAIFMFVAGLGTLMLWLSELIGPILEGGVSENMGPYTTMFTHGLDSATITPACVLAGISLLRRKPLGYLLTPPLLILCILNGLNVLAGTASQTIAGIIFPPGVYVGMIGSWVVMGAFAVWLAAAFFRNLEEAPEPRLAMAAAQGVD